jgi:hypothetical protein
MERTSPVTASPALAAEAAHFTRHVLGVSELDPALAARYAEGCARLLAAPEPPRETALVAFAVRRPWALPFLDAACALVAPQSLLRRKLLLVLAVLEATPAHLAVFTPRPQPRWLLILRLGGWGLKAGLQAAVGLCLLPWARRTE